ncbi:MAG: tryptophan--tRNA ligase [Candidatus Micrarchaeaceae archaeon]
MAESFHVDPYKVEGKIDYQKFADTYGLQIITEQLEKRIMKYTGTLHPLLKRHIFYAHRELNWLLDEYEKGNKFYIYTGIAPSGAMTLGHLVPFMLTQWLQEKFDADVYIQIPDEEKFLAKKDPSLTLEKVHELAYDDAATILALGFKKSKTKIFFDTEYAKTMYKQAVRVAKRITFSMMKDAFGFTNDTNIGSIFYTSMQAVPAFLKSLEEGHNVPCLIPLAIDQDVHFRIARDSIAKLGYYKPSIIYAKFLPGLSGKAKMSASDPLDTIYLNDSKEIIEKKIQRAYTGQQATAELQRKYGGDPDKCVVCQYYKYIFEPDDRKLAAIFDGERNGTLLAGEHKKDLATRVVKYVMHLQNRKEHMRSELDKYILRD